MEFIFENLSFILPFLISFFSLFFSVYSLFLSKRKTYIENVSNERLVRMTELRELLLSFATEYNKSNRDIETLKNIKFNIMLYLSNTNKNQIPLINVLNKFELYEKNYISDLTDASQIALNCAWKVYKTESFYSKKMQKAIRKVDYRNNVSFEP